MLLSRAPGACIAPLGSVASTPRSQIKLEVFPFHPLTAQNTQLKYLSIFLTLQKNSSQENPHLSLIISRLCVFTSSPTSQRAGVEMREKAGQGCVGELCGSAYLSSISVCRLSICLEMERSVSGACRSARQYVRLWNHSTGIQGSKSHTLTDIPAGKASSSSPQLQLTVPCQKPLLRGATHIPQNP